MRHQQALFAIIPLLIALISPLPVGLLVAAESEAPGGSEAETTIAAPRILSLEDTPNDAGTSIGITWELSATESVAPGTVIEYHVLRAESLGGEFTQVGAVAAGTDSYNDEGTEPGKPYWYKIIAVGATVETPSQPSGPAYSIMQWFNHDLWPVLILMAMTCILVVVYITIARRRKGKIFLRRLPVFDAINEAIGRATEMGKSVLYIMGQLDVDNPQTVASMSILARVADRTASYGTRLDIPCVWPMAMSMARETVKESYLRVGKPDEYSEDDIYYLTTDQFGYVAGVDGIMMRDRPAANFYLGAFYAESLVFAETGYATGAIQIAGTAEIDQLPFFVVACDYTLIGEELYAAGASLSADPVQLGSIRGQDVAKVVFFLIIVVGVVFKLMGIDIIDEWLAIG